MERVLVPAALPRLLRAVHAALVEHRDEIDALNVFPVPDGDTGSNLAATAAAVVDALVLGTEGPHLVHAALRSARGNSGVIFSQVVRAVVEAVHAEPGDGAPGEDVGILATALAAADALAREAVAEPVEGTILTALRVAAETAQDAVDDGQVDLVLVLAQVLDDVSEAVLATRDQLEVLREAGVVDAGARGLEVAIAALQSALTGEALDVAPLGQVVPRCLVTNRADVDANPFEVQFVLEGTPQTAADLRRALGDVGDSVVVVEADGLVSAHVHTSDADAAVAAGEAAGQPSDVRVTDLREGQVDAAELDVVAVLPAGGLADLGRGSGAAIVEGAAGALPSVDDLLRAARSCPGDRVLVLPGHPNVVPTARQAAELAAQGGGPVLEILAEARHPLAVLACLALVTADLKDCAEAVASCRVGEVVAAVRDAPTPAGPVRAGQPLVVVDGDVVAVTDDLSQALARLLVLLDAGSADLVTVSVGVEAEIEVGDVMAVVVEHAGEAEVEVLGGGQRPALLLVSVES